MVRAILSGVAAVLLGLSAFFWWKAASAAGEPMEPPTPAVPLVVAQEPLRVPPAASARSREEKRFDRYDKDRDQNITRAEYLASRRKAWTKLDSNGDGALSFEEWSAKSAGRFATADADRSGKLDRSEFATTRPRRKVRAHCACPAEGRDGEG